MLIRQHDIRVATIEDDDEFRDHLAALINGANGYCCVGSFRNAETAIKHFAASPPDVLLLDLELPGRNGLEVIAEMVARWPKLAIIILTIHDECAKIFTALEAGAIGYLGKPVSPVRLLEAIAEAHAGGSPMSSPIARMVVRKFQEQGRVQQKLDQLTARENGDPRPNLPGPEHEGDRLFARPQRSHHRQPPTKHLRQAAGPFPLRRHRQVPPAQGIATACSDADTKEAEDRAISRTPGFGQHARQSTLWSLDMLPTQVEANPQGCQRVANT